MTPVSAREVSIPTPLSRFAHKVAFAFLKGLGGCLHAYRRVSAPLAPFFSLIGRVFTRWVLLPIYRTLVMVRIRVGRVLASARGLLFLVFTNRYIFHSVILIASVATTFSQWNARQATAMEAGRQTMLYAIVNDGRVDAFEEMVEPETFAKDTHYLGMETIQAMPDIDYDYEPMEDYGTDEQLPGTIAVIPGLEPGEQTDVHVQRTKTETYAIQPGDTLGTIARHFQVTVGTITSANNLTMRSVLKPGDSLKIPPVSGVLHTVKKGDTLQKLASAYKINADEILTANHLAPDAVLAVGEELILPGAIPLEPPKPKPIAVRPEAQSSATIRNKNFDKYQELNTIKTDSRPKPADNTTVPTTKLLWPTTGRVITQYYGWKHTGLDIDGDYVDPLYASDDGVVETSGWNSGGYGLQIVIDHGNGFRTRYAHASKLFVKKGDVVKRGQVIAMLGTTGRSTGTHLHYEVYVNGKRVNPLSYTR